MSREQPRYENAMDEIATAIKACVPLIWVVTHEEERLIHDLHEEMCVKENFDLNIWSAYQGLMRHGDMKIERMTRAENKTQSPGRALASIEDRHCPEQCEGMLFLFRDLQDGLDTIVTRQLRDMYLHMSDQGKTVIVVSSRLAHGAGGKQDGLPPSLEKQMTVIYYDLPDTDILRKLTSRVLDNSLKFQRTGEGEQILDKHGKPKSEAYNEDDMQAIIRACQGLTAVETDNALASSLEYLKEIDPYHILQTKKQIVRRSNVLEYIEPEVSMADVGGLDVVKDYLAMYALGHTEKYQAFGAEPLKGVILTGIPGCLSGDSKILFNRGKRPGFREISLEKLYQRFNQVEDRYSWDPEIPTFLYSFDGESKLVKNRLLGVIDSGVKDVITITAGEDCLTLTADHPVCTPSGEFVQAGSLVKGDKVLIKGSMKPQFDGGKKLSARPKRKTVETLKFYPHGHTHTVNGCDYQRTNFARLIIEAHMNSMEIDQFITILKSYASHASQLKYLDPKYDVHHIDENPLNDEIGNLMILEHGAHAKLHGKTENLNVDYLQEATVRDIRDGGKVQTYDIQMEYPNNNFVSNGFIVHNTGKSLLAKVLGASWKVPLLRLDIGKVMTGLVGGSEGQMRQVISLAEAMSPCILWVDEVEKAISGTGSSNHSDGGTTSRVFGTLLHAMQDGLKGVTTVATANDITKVPPEFIRRFDDIFFCDLPGPEERWDVFKIHLAHRGRDISLIEAKKKDVLLASEGFTGAEVEKAVRVAIASAFFLKKKEMDYKDILQALADLKPISVTMADKIEDLRDQAKNHYRYASSWAQQNSSRISIRTSDGGALSLDNDSLGVDDLMADSSPTQTKSKDRFRART